MTSTRAVLHITSAPGGGVDRYIRDIAAATPFAHLALHVGAAVDVVEDLRTGALWPLAAASDAAADVLARTTALVHLHAVDARSRAWAARLRGRSSVALVTTLHDVGFVYRDAFAAHELRRDAQWTREVTTVVGESDLLIAPSSYIASLAREAMPGSDPIVITPGIPDAVITDQALPLAFTARRPRHVVAVVGAIGPHKGSALLSPIAQGLAALDAALVVIGYTDSRIYPGWGAPGLFVHGPYVDAALPGLLAAYEPRVALFPNRIPESFSYTLSEVWACAIPVIVPDEGALGERVRDTGAGWLLPPRFDAPEVLPLLAQLLTPAGDAEWRRVKSQVVLHSESIPDLPSMTRGVTAVYQRFGVASAPSAQNADLSALRPLLAANLNGLVFREELVHLCEALDNSAAAARAAAAEAQGQAQHARDVQAWADKLQADVDETRAWATKLERDVATLNEQLASSAREVQTLNGTVAELRGAMAALPGWVQRMLLRRAQRGRA